jgi:hypothetical protein
MSDLRAAAQQALNSLRGYRREIGCEQLCDAERALEAALEQTEQEPCDIAKDGVCEAAQEQFCDGHCTWRDHHPACVRAEQPQRTLTDEVIADLWHANGGFHHHFARAVERWLKGQA